MSKNETNLTALSSALADAVQSAGQSIVTVDARQRFPGTGVITASGRVLTASHVVQEDEIKVILPEGDELQADLLGRDAHSDLALLKLSADKGTASKTNESPQVGQLALALGRPTTEGVQASLGIVSAIGGPLRSPYGGMLESYLRTDAVPFPGFSGGPLADAQGAVLGINTSGLGIGASLTIPTKLAWKIAAAIEEHGGVKRGYLGIRSQLVEVPDEGRKALNREQAGALLIMGVEGGSPAKVAGLIVGDIIVGFNGQPVSDHDELLGLLQGDVVGKPAAVEVLRGGKQQIVQVTIAELQESDPEPRRYRRGFHRWGWGRR
ncbi:MAG: S1C family serine protease [Anaerolineales bacterium]